MHLLETRAKEMTINVSRITISPKGKINFNTNDILPFKLLQVLEKALDKMESTFQRILSPSDVWGVCVGVFCCLFCLGVCVCVCFVVLFFCFDFFLY